MPGHIGIARCMAMRLPLRRAFAVTALTLCPGMLFAQSETIGATFTFDDTQHGDAVTHMRNQVLTFQQFRGGGLLDGVRVTVSLRLIAQAQHIFGSCAGTSDCGGGVRVVQTIYAEPVVTIDPGGLNRRLPVRLLPGQTSDVAIFRTADDCHGATSCRADRIGLSFTPGGSIHQTSFSFHMDPSDLFAFMGNGTIPIQVGLTLKHEPQCTWREEDDSLLLFVDFTEFFLSCPTLNSIYVGAWAFSITVRYTAFTTGFKDVAPTAVAGGPYVGVTGVPVIFDGSGSLPGSSTASDVITSYEWDFDSDGLFDVQSASPTAQHIYQSPYTGEVALRVTRNDATNNVAIAAVRITSRFDLDHDADVDTTDLNLLLRDRGKAVAESACGQACDLDGDGFITAIDARLLTAQCTRPNCATQ